MKKIFALMLLAVPMVFGLTSCNDDDDLPDVSMSITVSNATKIDDVIYLVQGDTLNIDSIGITNNEAGKAAAITEAVYYWDYRIIGTSILPPYGFKIITSRATSETDGTPLGKHLLQIETPVLAVDKEVATAILVYTVQVVASEDDIPQTGTKPDAPDKPTFRS